MFEKSYEKLAEKTETFWENFGKIWRGYKITN